MISYIHQKINNQATSLKSTQIKKINKYEEDETTTKTPEEDDIKHCFTTEDDNDTNNNKNDEINKLLSCLKYSRFKYNSWLDVGIIIYNATNNINF